MAPLEKVLALAQLPLSLADRLAEEHSIHTVHDLAEAARAQRLQTLPSLNLSLENHLLRCIRELSSADEGILMDVACFQAAEVERWLAEREGVQRSEIVGGLRRGKELVRRIEILAAARDPGRVLRSFPQSPLVREVKAKGRTWIEGISTLGLPVTLHGVPPDRLAAALLNLTASEAHLRQLRAMASRQGLRLEDILSQAGPDEEEIYQRLGLAFIPTELREGQGEIEAALEDGLPHLIVASQLQGDLHLHTAWADGLHSIETMAEAARAKGYKYIAICDHSPLIEEANGLDQVRVAAQAEEIERLNRRYPDLVILKGLEVDIRANGELDMPDEALRKLDLVIASIHIPYGQDTQTVTRRLVAAMEHPLVDIIAHLTGRLLKEPDLYTVDVENLLRVAAETRTALEINADPSRLDLSAELARQARALGAPLVIGSDAHSVEQLGWIQFGLATARRGWLEGTEVLNALPLGELRERLKRH